MHTHKRTRARAHTHTHARARAMYRKRQTVNGCCVYLYVPVQAFLEDADSVLAALDQCQAEEKCLMLIKRPKDSARKVRVQEVSRLAKKKMKRG